MNSSPKNCHKSAKTQPKEIARGSTCFIRNATFRLLALVCFAYAPVVAQSLTVDYTIGNFTSAVSLSVNSSGEVIVLDAGANACVRFSHDGRELSRVQGSGWGSSEFDSPSDVSALFPLAVFVSDGKNRRLQQFDKDLQFVQTIENLQTIDGQSLSGAFRPIASAQSSQGELFMLDADGTRIIKMTTRFRAEREFGTYASGRGRLTSPVDLCLTDDGRVAVADGNAIVFFDQFGNFNSTITVGGDTLRTLSASGSECIAVSASAIYILNNPIGLLPESRRIEARMIFGESGVMFRDATRTEVWWYILTPKNILVCKRTDR